MPPKGQKKNTQNKSRASRPVPAAKARAASAPSGAGRAQNPRRRKPRGVSRQGSWASGAATATDGINNSRIMRNTSTIEDRFQIRTEKIGNVLDSVAFAVGQQLYINPGNTQLFPVFSQIASTYEQYRVNHLRFIYSTEAYTATTTSLVAGKVIQCTNFDPDDSNFSSDTQMENYEGMVKSAPFVSTVHDVIGAHRLRKRSDLSLNNYFVNSSANQPAPSASTSKFYDIGNYQLVTQGNASTGEEIGELYVEYSFTMIRPKQQTPAGQNLIVSHYTGTATTANTFTNMTQKDGSNLSLTFGANTLLFPTTGNVNGRYLVYYSAKAGTSFTQASATTASNACTIVADIATANATNNSISGSAGTQYTATCVADVQVGTISGVPTLTFGSPTIVGSTTCEVWVMQVPGAIAVNIAQQRNLVQKLQADLGARLARAERLLDSFSSRSPLTTIRENEPEQKTGTWLGPCAGGHPGCDCNMPGSDDDGEIVALPAHYNGDDKIPCLCVSRNCPGHLVCHQVCKGMPWDCDIEECHRPLLGHTYATPSGPLKIGASIILAAK